LMQCFPDGETFLAAAAQSPPDIILLGIALPGMGSLETLTRVNQLFTESKVIILSDHQRSEFAFRAMRLGAHDVILEPYHTDRMNSAIQAALNMRTLERETRRLKNELRIRHDFKNIIGTTPTTCKMLDEMRRCAESSIPVLFRGESGTGKELAARTLHYNSPRADEPFFYINCAVLRKERSLEEVFAPIQNSTSKRDRKSDQYKDRSQGGTIFLDEIGNMDPSILEALLSRMDHSGKIRVTKCSPPIDARLLFSVRTNHRELANAEKVISGLFRRFSPYEIYVPSLRERANDIEPLVKFFLSEFEADKHGLTSNVSIEAMQVLSTYSWPGNIRELKNVIRQSSLMSEVSPIDLMDLPPSIRTGSICADFKLEIDNAELKNESVRKSEPKEIHPQRETISPSITADEKRDLPCELNGHTKDKEAPISIISLREAEKNMIKQALAFTGGNLTRTASLLEISRSALYRRLDKLQISRNQY
ncbi:MAG: sigma-54-dependent Fis family transcriptional regulator, partial [Nitrospinaceae bacterium]|nr:sigma-54-dependent Fis family transcriptional regulator [Nitrospinaceae bacterium]